MSEITRDYPIPNRAPSGRWVDLFVRMRPGDSVVVTRGGLKGLRSVAVRQAGGIRQKKITGDSFRVWRIK